MGRKFLLVVCLLVILSMIGAGFASRRTVVITPRDTESGTAAEVIAPTPSANGKADTESLTDAVTDTTETTADTTADTQADTLDETEVRYVLNTNTKKFHRPDCASVRQMKDKNRTDFTGSRDEALALGFSPCGNCKP